ncbi:hypothetical protein GH714_035653 [Hevea brasiliensis]|uniref:Uncharacterized protein n=1 Tax=Hevea brasiliensis TaxID=3981 RepID=A0A6A6L3Q1_HEVBR|nr:hypothetical protein GH714_035621 [Hevea brasiliensis]KAF2296009.1 hypothetical protein GH714_035653 [Hevea brasiliensis]
MENPQPNQISNYSLDGEVQYLFTKTLSRDDMLGLNLNKDSNDYFRGLPNPLLNQIAKSGLEIEIYTPNCKNWVMMRVGDKIDCWSLYHANVGPQGILSLLIQKATQVRVENIDDDATMSS